MVAAHQLPRLTPSLLGGASGARLARRGARSFKRGGDVVVTLPHAAGPLHVLVPRGHGQPLIARRQLGGGFCAAVTGEPCAATRWTSAGAIAAWLREIPSPRGPSPALSPLGCFAPAEGVGTEGTGPWVCVRVVAASWAAARRADPSVGHGTVAVAGRWVLGVSPAARARGVCRGMSLSRARSLCPGIRLVPPAEGAMPSELVDEVVALLERDLGAVTRRRGAVLVRLASGPANERPGDRLAQAGHLARRLWQALGVEVRIAVADAPEDAVALSRQLDVGWVAVVPPSANGAWHARHAAPGTWTTGRKSATWRGPLIPDLEGAATVCRDLSRALALGEGGGTVRIVAAGPGGEVRVVVPLPPGCDRATRATLVEAAVRTPLLAARGAFSVRVEATHAARPAIAPVALAPGLR